MVGSVWRRGIIFWDSHGERLPSSGEKDGREASLMDGVRIHVSGWILFGGGWKIGYNAAEEKVCWVIGFHMYFINVYEFYIYLINIYEIMKHSVNHCIHPNAGMCVKACDIRESECNHLDDEGSNALKGRDGVFC